MTKLMPTVQLGFLLPEDIEAAAALVEEVLETARQEQAALEFLSEKEIVVDEPMI